mmetsp:Transcript_14436/g.41513  ORF Transcript_14436/g.41513 Transcript_14436/m.41513 type:complete len:485 (-) Transcript_14436:312-1766(-)
MMATAVVHDEGMVLRCAIGGTAECGVPRCGQLRPSVVPTGAQPAGRTERSVFWLRILSLAGRPYSEFRVGPRAKVGSLKRRAMVDCGVPVAEQRLVFAGRVLRDDESLEDSGALGAAAAAPGGEHQGLPAVVLQCVRTGPSGSAQSLEALANIAAPELAIGASVADLLDSTARAAQELSERSRPRDPAAVLRAIDPQHRSVLITWTATALDLLGFDEALLHSVVLTLDRYCASRDSAVDVGGLQELLLAVVCAELKVGGAAELRSRRWQLVLRHLAQGHVDLETVLRSECEVLLRLGLRVGLPTPVTFLGMLSPQPPCAGSEALAASVFDLALFFLSLCLYEPRVAYAYPHCLLAGGALAAALRVLGAEHGRDGRDVACERMWDRLVEDLAAFGLRTHCRPEARIAQCAEAILELFVAEAGASGENGACGGGPSPSFAALVDRFASRTQGLARGQYFCADNAQEALRRLRGSRGGRKSLQVYAI